GEGRLVRDDARRRPGGLAVLDVARAQWDDEAPMVLVVDEPGERLRARREKEILGPVELLVVEGHAPLHVTGDDVCLAADGAVAAQRDDRLRAVALQGLEVLEIPSAHIMRGAAVRADDALRLIRRDQS